MPAAIASTLRALLAAALAALAACADPNTAPRAAGAPALAKAPPSVGSCSTAPAQGVRVTQDQVTLTLGSAATGSATVTACTQYAGAYLVTSDHPAVATVTPSGMVTPTRPAEDAPNAAALTITGVSPGTATITVTDRRGYTAQIAVTVKPAPVGVLTLSPGTTVTFTGPSQSAALEAAQPGYAGPLAITCASAGAGAACAAVPPADLPAGWSGAVGCAAGTRLGAYVTQSAPQQVTVFVDQFDGPPLSCVVRVQGAPGTAPVDVTIAYLPGDGNFTFSPPGTAAAPYRFAAGFQDVFVTVSEGQYASAFHLTGRCTTDGSGCHAASGADGGVTLLICNGGQSTGTLLTYSFDAPLGNATPSTLHVVSAPGSPGPALTCSAEVADVNGHTAWYTATLPAQ